MQSIPGDKSDEHKCAVYRVLKDVQVCTSINVLDERKDGRSFKPDQLVSVDLVRPSRFPTSTNGPFLRLTDNTGWVFQKKYGETLLERLPVEIGLWCFVVDNYYLGIALRNHPFDKSDTVEPQVVYRPNRKIYCDRKVVHPITGVASYRVQGTSGWVFDKRICGNGRIVYMILPESAVQTGLFAYELLANIGVRERPTTARSDTENLRISVFKNDVVCCDVVRDTYPKRDGCGPFLRLNDGTGWIFGKICDTGPLVRSLPIVDGRWGFEIRNEPHGLALRRQPIDRAETRTDRVFDTGDWLYCDKKITSASTGVSFYRVVGTEGWIFDRRNGKSMLKPIESPGAFHNPTIGTDEQGSWKLDFLRRLASAFELEEIMCNEVSRVISFRNQFHERVNVYYTTRTIGTTVHLPSQGNTQMFRRDCTIDELKKILRHPQYMVGRGYQSRAMSPYGEGEEDSRRSLLECDADIARLLKFRSSLLKSIEKHDVERATITDAMHEKTKAYEAKIHCKRKAAAAAEREHQAEVARQQSISYTCQECDRTFINTHALNQHCRDAHQLQCEVCYKIFRTQNALYNHCNALGHW